MMFTKISPWASALVLAMLATGSASAASIAKGDPDSGGNATVGSGVQAAFDRDGMLRAPTSEETAALLQGMARFVDQSSVGLKVRVLANGTRIVNLEDRFQDVAIARMVNGQPEFACIDSLADAKAFLERKPAADSKPTAPRVGQRTTTVLEEK
jgi:hypothetical protein